MSGGLFLSQILIKPTHAHYLIGLIKYYLQSQLSLCFSHMTELKVKGGGNSSPSALNRNLPLL